MQGLHRGTLAELESARGEIGPQASTVRIANRLRAYATKYRPSPAAERFAASTEILESRAMSAVVGGRTDEAIRVASESTPQKVVDRWFERVGGRSVPWLRQQFVRGAKA